MNYKPDDTHDQGPTERHSGDRLIDLPAVLRRVPVARSTLFERIREGAFPKGRKFGRRRLWLESEVDAFVGAVE